MHVGDAGIGDAVAYEFRFGEFMQLIPLEQAMGSI